MIIRLLPLAILISTSPALAFSMESLTTGYNYTDYSAGHGTRNSIFADLKTKIDNGAVVIGIEQGKRDYGQGESFDAFRGKASVWYNWNDVLATRSSISLGENSPVFVRREILNDFNLKLVKNMVLTLGGRHAQYYGNTEVNSWSAGGSIYSGPLITTYRYTRYDTVGVDNSYSHLLTVRLKDNYGKGSTQFWASTGTGAYTYDWTPETRKGKLHSLSLKRIQPLTEQFAFGLVLGKQWFDTPTSNYSGLQGIISLEWRV